jgi:hypothetical protein
VFRDQCLALRLDSGRSAEVSLLAEVFLEAWVGSLLHCLPVVIDVVLSSLQNTLTENGSRDTCVRTIRPSGFRLYRTCTKPPSVAPSAGASDCPFGVPIAVMIRAGSPGFRMAIT